MELLNSFKNLNGTIYFNEECYEKKLDLTLVKEVVTEKSSDTVILNYDFDVEQNDNDGISIDLSSIEETQLLNETSELYTIELKDDRGVLINNEDIVSFKVVKKDFTNNNFVFMTDESKLTNSELESVNVTGNKLKFYIKSNDNVSTNIIIFEAEIKSETNTDDTEEIETETFTKTFSFDIDTDNIVNFSLISDEFIRYDETENKFYKTILLANVNTDGDTIDLRDDMLENIEVGIISNNKVSGSDGRLVSLGGINETTNFYTSSNIDDIEINDKLVIIPSNNYSESIGLGRWNIDTIENGSLSLIEKTNKIDQDNLKFLIGNKQRFNSCNSNIDYFLISKSKLDDQLIEYKIYFNDYFLTDDIVFYVNYTNKADIKSGNSINVKLMEYDFENDTSNVNYECTDEEGCTETFSITNTVDGQEVPVKDQIRVVYSEGCVIPTTVLYVNNCDNEITLTNKYDAANEKGVPSCTGRIEY